MTKIVALYLCIWSPAVLSVSAFLICAHESRRVEDNEVAFTEGYQKILFWAWGPMFLIIPIIVCSVVFMPKKGRGFYLIQLFLSFSIFALWVSNAETLIILNPHEQP